MTTGTHTATAPMAMATRRHGVATIRATAMRIGGLAVVVVERTAAVAAGSVVVAGGAHLFRRTTSSANLRDGGTRCDRWWSAPSWHADPASPTIAGISAAASAGRRASVCHRTDAEPPSMGCACLHRGRQQQPPPLARWAQAEPRWSVGRAALRPEEAAAHSSTAAHSARVAVPELLADRAEHLSRNGCHPTCSSTPPVPAVCSQQSSATSTSSTSALPSVISSQSFEERLAVLEACHQPRPALLRLNEEAKRLANDLVDLRFRHYEVEDKAGALERRQAQLDVLLGRSAPSDPALLGNKRQLPPPAFAPAPAVPAATGHMSLWPSPGDAAAYESSGDARAGTESSGDARVASEPS